MKKAFDQTVRDLKREVNKKVLKVPSIEQKVLDATSNEPWGPHGTLLADIAQATRNYHEYQMIMAIIWKRINDTGKNWRHVYKALLVLEYLVGHGSERVIDEIKEHTYQISTLSDFQYIDHRGTDQGNNVRRKSQSLVIVVNDKEKIVEVRQKAAANREKYRSTSAGGMYRPSSYGDKYDDDRYEGRYGSRDDDRNGYGYGREGSYRDDDRYGRYGDSYGDRFGRDNDERSNRDDDYRGRSRSIDDYGPRSRSADRYDDDTQSSSRGARADDRSQDGSIGGRLERKFSEQNVGAPPSYEDATSESRSPAHTERDGEASAASVPGASPPPVPKASSPPVARAISPPVSHNRSQATTPFGTVEAPEGHGTEMADEFDPRGLVSAAPAAPVAPAPAPTPTPSPAPVPSPTPNPSKNVELDLLGSLVDSFTPTPLAIMPAPSSTTAPEINAQSNFSGSTFTAQLNSSASNMGFEDPFGDAPFKAIPSTDNVSSQPQLSAASLQPMVPKADMLNSFGFGDAFSSTTYAAPNVQNPSATSQFTAQLDDTDVLAGILPPSAPSSAVASEGVSVLGAHSAQSSASTHGDFNSQAGYIAPTASSMGPQAPPFGSGNFPQQGGPAVPNPSTIAPQTPLGPTTHFNNGNFMQQGSASPVISQGAHYAPIGPVTQVNNGNYLQRKGSGGAIAPQNSNDVMGNMFSQGASTSVTSQSNLPSSAGPLAIVPQPSKDKFETKSTIWADTLSRGLVNLNISGSKINPLADIGVDFDAINRKEKRMEKQSTTPATSTVTMGKAMGSGSGIGRAGAGALRPPPNAMMGSAMGIGGGGMNMGMGMNSAPMGYGGMNQPMGRGMGMGMNMGVNMGMGQGGPMQAPTGFPPGSNMSGGYYTQQPYGGGYR